MNQSEMHCPEFLVIIPDNSVIYLVVINYSILHKLSILSIAVKMMTKLPKWISPFLFKKDGF